MDWIRVLVGIEKQLNYNMSEHGTGLYMNYTGMLQEIDFFIYCH